MNFQAQMTSMMKSTKHAWNKYKYILHVFQIKEQNTSHHLY